MARVFLTYAREDLDIAKQLQHLLLGHKHELVFDVAAIAPGQLWRDEIDRQMRTCDAIIALITPNALKSEWVPYELGFARALGFRSIIPLISPGADHPSVISDRQGIPLLTDTAEGLKVALPDLLKALYDTLQHAPQVQEAPVEAALPVRPSTHRTSLAVVLSVATSTLASFLLLAWNPRTTGAQDVAQGPAGPPGPIGPSGSTVYANGKSPGHNIISLDGSLCGATEERFRGGELKGWGGAKELCEQTCGSGSAHICTSEELLRFAITGGKMVQAKLWYASGIRVRIGDSGYATDCDGFTSNSGYGSTWAWEGDKKTGGAPDSSSCGSALAVACCD